MSRKLTLTKTKQTTLEACLKRGIRITTSCRIAGVGRRTFYEWMRRGDQGEAPYQAFSDAILKAQADGENALMQLLEGHAKDDPSTARWLLSKRSKAAYGVEGEAADPMDESYSEATEAEVVELMAGNPQVRAAVLAAVAKEKQLGTGKD